MLDNDEEEGDFVTHFEDNYYGAFIEDTTMGESEKNADA
jgi:hypothetical protein